MELTLKEITSSNIGNLFLVSSRERDIDIFKRKSLELCYANKIIMKILRGQRCNNKKTLFQEFAAALQFPYYFGHNWDALDECLVDLSWLPANKYNLFITNFNEVLTNNSKDLHMLMEILKESIPNWVKETRNNMPNQAPVAFNIILHCEPRNEQKCKEILKKVKIKPEIRILKPYDDIL